MFISRTSKDSHSASKLREVRYFSLNIPYFFKPSHDIDYLGTGCLFGKVRSNDDIQFVTNILNLLMGLVVGIPSLIITDFSNEKVEQLEQYKIIKVS